MLNKLEKAVMTLLYERCVNKESALIAPNQVIISLLPQFQVSKQKLDKIMNNLMIDGYIDVINSNNKGHHIYCISLKEKGIAFKREILNQKKQTRYLLVRKIALALIGVVATLLFTWLINTLRG